MTVALVEERGGTLTIVNCGHPAPLLLRRGEVIPLEPPTNAPPLGFMPVVQPRVDRLEPGDRILLYTDGLAEARRDGEFFPIGERAWGLLGHGTVGDGLASLESALVEWVEGQLDDDIALVLMEYAGRRRPNRRAAVPSWEVGTDVRRDSHVGRQRARRGRRVTTRRCAGRCAARAGRRCRRDVAPSQREFGAVPAGVAPRVLRREHRVDQLRDHEILPGYWATSWGRPVSADTCADRR